MVFIKRIKKEVKQVEFDYSNCEVLSYEQLLAVNGAGGSSSGSSGSGAASAPSGSSGSGTASNPSSGSTSSSTTTGSGSSSTAGSSTSTPSTSGTTNSGTTGSNSSGSTTSTSTSNRVENSNEGVANAKPGDTIQRKDGTVVTLTQGDIDWAKKQVGSTSTSTGSTSGSSNSTNTSSGTGSSTSGSTTGSNTSSSSLTGGAGTSTTQPAGGSTTSGTTTGSTSNSTSTSTTKPTTGSSGTTTKPTSGSTTGSTSTTTKPSTGSTTGGTSGTTSNRVENSNEGVAGAKPGDTIKRSDGTIYTLTEGDIKWAQDQIASTAGNNTPVESTPETNTSGGITFPSDAASGNNHFGTDITLNPVEETKDSSTGTSTPTNGKDISISVDLPPVSGITPPPVDTSNTGTTPRNPKDDKEAEIVEGENTNTKPTENGSTEIKPTVIPGKPTKSDGTHTDAATLISDSISDNWEKEYSYTSGYRCDNWVEEVLNDAGYKSSDYLKGGAAASTTVQEHIDALTNKGKEGVDYTTTRPTEDGAYVVFMDNGTIKGNAVGEHAAILIIKDGKATFYDNSSGNGGTPTYVTDKDGNPTDTVSYYDRGVGATDGSVNWCYSDMYYQKIQ